MTTPKWLWAWAATIIMFNLWWWAGADLCHEHRSNQASAMRQLDVDEYDRRHPWQPCGEPTTEQLGFGDTRPECARPSRDDAELYKISREREQQTAKR